MSGIDKAVILAAGRGNRISAIAAGTPKPLLPIDGPGGATTFLDWHLFALAAAGCREIYLVGNRQTHGTRLRAMDRVAATWILNPTEDLSTSGSAHSASFAWESPHRILDGKSRVVLMDADLAYDPSLFALLAAAPPGHSKTLVCTAHRDTGEEVLVFADAKDPEAPRVHGKGLSGTPLVEGSPCLGEATGILLFEPEDHALLRAATDWVLRFSTAKQRSEHEDVTARLMARDRVRAVRFGEELAFMECDSPEEYAALVGEMWPKLARTFERI
jgi:choline kinase